MNAWGELVNPPGTSRCALTTHVLDWALEAVKVESISTLRFPAEMYETFARACVTLAGWAAEWRFERDGFWLGEFA